MMRYGGLLIAAALIIGLLGGYLTGKRAGFTAAEKELKSSERKSSERSGSTSGHDWQRVGNRRTTSATSNHRITSAEGESLNASFNPLARVVELGQSPDPAERLGGLLELAASLRAEEFKETVEAYIVVGNWEDRITELNILLHAWAEADPEGAVEYITHKTLPLKARAAVLTAWAKSSPDEALEFARKYDRPGQANYVNPLLVGVINGLAQVDPQRAAELIVEIPEGEGRVDALRGVVITAMEDGLDSALAWSDGIADPNTQTEAMKLILRNVAARDPVRAAEMMAEMGDAPAAVEVADRLAYSFAKLDTDSAIEWTRALAGEQQSNAARGIMIALARDEPHRASEYLESMKGSTELNFAITTFIWGAANVEPALAVGWIENVSSPQTQHKMYRHILSRWLRNDREAANQWIETNTLPPGVIEALPLQ